MGRSRRPSARRRFGLIAALTLPLLLLGGVSPITLAASSLGIFILFLVSVPRFGSPIGRPLPARLVVVAAWLHAAFVALQLVPLPPRLLALLSPRTARDWHDVSVVFAIADRAHPISLDPNGSRFALATALAVAAYADLVTRIARTRSGQRDIGVAVAMSTVVFAVVAILSKLMGRGVALGLYEPRNYYPPDLPITPTLLNANHAAAAMSVAPPLLFAMATERKATVDRAFAFFTVAFMTVCVVLTLSRGGIAVVTLEVLAMSAFTWRWREGRLPALRVLVPFAMLVLVGVTAASVAGEALVREAAVSDLSKIAVFRRAATMIAHYPFVGVGRGAFAAAFAPFEPAGGGGFSLYSHAENLPIHLAAELGVPAGVTIIGLLLFAITASLRSAMSRPLAAGALVALIGLAVHELFDFATEFVGVAMLAASLLALVTAPTAEATAPRGQAEQTPASASRWAPVAALLAVVPLLFFNRRPGLEEDQAAIASAWREGRLAHIRQMVDDAALAYPADPYCALAAGVARLPDSAAAAHALRAINLAPNRAISHVWLARILVRLGRTAQAWAEYREALRLSSKVTDVVLADVVAFRAPIVELTLFATSEAKLDQIVRRLSILRREDEAEKLDQAMILDHPPAASARVREARRAAARGERAHAIDLARELQRILPNDGRGYGLESVLVEDSVEAERILERGIERCPDDIDLREGLLKRRGIRLGLESLEGEIAAVREMVVRRGLPAGHLLTVLGEVELARNARARALEYFLDAALTYPAAWGKVAETAAAAEGAKQWSIASMGWRRLAAAFPDDTKFSAAVARTEAELARALLSPTPRP